MIYKDTTGLSEGLKRLPSLEMEFGQRQTVLSAAAGFETAYKGKRHVVI